MEPITKDIKQLKGCLPKPKTTISLEEMKSAIKTQTTKATSPFCKLPFRTSKQLANTLNPENRT